MKAKKLLYRFVFLLIVVFSISSCRKSDYSLENGEETIRDNGFGTGTVTWSKDKDYILEGKIFVNDGQVLTIEAGTVVRALTGQGNAASALIVARGGKIIAKGNADAPIIFTVAGDDLKGSVPYYSKGLWGGLIILGNATLNIEGGESHVEGIPLSEPRGIFGGWDDSDNSGVLKYVSIRHGGTNIGEGNEINGLTLAGVGDATVVDHVEIISNADDGIEFFGGTVNCNNIIVAFCGDDAFDYDMGYRGKGQFWFAYQDPAVGNNIVEADGGIDPIVAAPYSIPQVYNATFIGRGLDIGDHLISFSNNAGGKFVNSIFINQGKGIDVEFDPDGDDSFRQFQIANLELKNNIFYQIADNSPAGIFQVSAKPGVNISDQQAEFQGYFGTAGNVVLDPGIEIDGLQVFPIPQGNVYDNIAGYPDPWFENVSYKGAFGSYNWAYGWTLLSQQGLLQ
jgi:hypothetical protein